jgi:hypothetical protein
MMTWKLRAALAFAFVLGAAGLATLPAADDPPKGEPLVVTDTSNKEFKLKDWKFARGVRRLAWLAPAPAKEKEPDPKEKAPRAPKPPAGPEAFEMREEHSTGFLDGILTLLPLDRIKSIDFDPEKQTITVKVAATDKDDAELTGTTKFQGINKLTIEADVDKGDLGIAELKFLGGVPKGTLRSVRFPAPKLPAKVPGTRAATVTDTDKPQKTTHNAANLRPLYRFADGSERLLPTLMFKKTLKLDIDKIKKLAVAEEKPKDPDSPEWVVSTKDGEEATLSLLKTITVDGKQAVLVGLLGEVSGGYKLFPVHTISEVQFMDKSELKE